MFSVIWFPKRVHWVINRVFWIINSVFYVIWSMFSIFSIFSMFFMISVFSMFSVFPMFSQPTPCSPFQDAHLLVCLYNCGLSNPLEKITTTIVYELKDLTIIASRFFTIKTKRYLQCQHYSLLLVPRHVFSQHPSPCDVLQTSGLFCSFSTCLHHPTCHNGMAKPTYIHTSCLKKLGNTGCPWKKSPLKFIYNWTKSSLIKEGFWEK